jgi:hypothetical protein
MPETSKFGRGEVKFSVTRACMVRYAVAIVLYILQSIIQYDGTAQIPKPGEHPDNHGIDLAQRAFWLHAILNGTWWNKKRQLKE